MRDKERIDRICEELRQLWHLYPDQRLLQLIENYVSVRNPAPFYMEDDISEGNIVGAINAGHARLIAEEKRRLDMEKDVFMMYENGEFKVHS